MALDFQENWSIFGMEKKSSLWRIQKFWNCRSIEKILENEMLASKKIQLTKRSCWFCVFLPKRTNIFGNETRPLLVGILMQPKQHHCWLTVDLTGGQSSVITSFAKLTQIHFARILFPSMTNFQFILDFVTINIFFFFRAFPSAMKVNQTLINKLI